MSEQTVINRADFAATVRTFLGTPYRHQGRTPGHRLDCIGIMVCGLALHGWRPRRPDLVATLDYDMRAKDASLERIIEGEAQRIELEDAKPGDILVFRWPRQQFAQHCGVITQTIGGVNYFVHAYNSPTHRTVVEHPLRDEWRALLTGVYRLHDLSD